MLPNEEQVAHQIVASQLQYEVLEGELYHLEDDKSLRIIPPETERRRTFEDRGTFRKFWWTSEGNQSTWTAGQTILVAKDEGRRQQVESRVYDV